MRKDTAGPESTSTAPTWETLEGMVRQKAQELIQHILEEEVTELLGRRKSERRAGVDAPKGYRNGYGKPRRLAMSSGTITVTWRLYDGSALAGRPVIAHGAERHKAVVVEEERWMLVARQMQEADR